MLPFLRSLLAVLGLAAFAQPLVAQKVTIKNASPALITETAAEYLASNRFVLVRSDSGSAEFGLNLGKIQQRSMSRSIRRPEDNLFWVIMEVHLRYKPKDDAVEVSVYEDALVLEDDSSLVERRRVTSHKELDNLRVFLDDLRKQVEARVQPTDSGKP
jgi:hypothetical protein